MARMISVKALKRVRMRAGLSQAEWADKLHVASGTVAGWELGTHTPQWENIRKIAEVSGVAVEDLLEREA